MAAFRELIFTSFFVLFSQISGQWSGNARIKQCGPSDLTIAFNFSLGTEHFFDRYWCLNSPTNKIAAVNSTGFLTVEPPFSSRVTLSGTNGITLANANSSDSGSYFFIFITDTTFKFLIATTTVIINEIPNNFCKPITETNTNSITCKIPAACPGKDGIQARWNDGSIEVLKCSSANTKYNCCAVGDPVTNCYNGSLCTETECKDETHQLEPGLEPGLGLGFGLGIPIVITSIVVLIFKCTGYKHAYYVGLALGILLGVTFQVSWIIIVSLIFTGTTSSKLELGLGLGLGSGILCLIAGIIALIFKFFTFSLLKGIPSRVEFGRGILNGLHLASVISTFVYSIYCTLKQEPTSTNRENVPLDQTDKKSKTKNPGDNPFRPQPPLPQNREIKERSLRGISASIGDTPDLASETPRHIKLPPLTAKQETVQEVDASEESKKKRKNKKKKDKMNVETPEEENGETNLRVK